MPEEIVGKIARKYMAHYLDASFGSTSKNYVRLGKDLEEYSVDLNPDVNVFKNIIGETSFTHNGYQRGGAVAPFYCEMGDPLFEKLQEIVDTEVQDDGLKTTAVEVHLWDAGSTTGTYTAYCQDVYVVPDSYGGDTSGYQIPFSVYHVGPRTVGTFTLSTKTFAPTNG
ncbi:MAG: hypothetical protein IJM76_05955 [Lachnospiraceae bacterium]|nr:hypothetical protein [Lachnospiraceae bacterium]